MSAGSRESPDRVYLEATCCWVEALQQDVRWAAGVRGRAQAVLGPS